MLFVAHDPYFALARGKQPELLLAGWWLDVGELRSAWWHAAGELFSKKPKGVRLILQLREGRTWYFEPHSTVLIFCSVQVNFSNLLKFTIKLLKNTYLFLLFLFRNRFIKIMIGARPLK